MEHNLNDTLNAHINTELWSSYLFLSMSVNAASKGLKGLSHWFYKQHQKELADAKKIIDYLNSIDSKVYLYPIEEVPAEWDSPLEMFKHKHEHDKKISRLIYATASIAEEMQHFPSIEFFKKFAADHLNEESVSSEFITAFEAVEGDKYALSILDKQLGERK